MLLSCILLVSLCHVNQQQRLVALILARSQPLRQPVGPNGSDRVEEADGRSKAFFVIVNSVGQEQEHRHVDSRSIQAALVCVYNASKARRAAEQAITPQQGQR